MTTTIALMGAGGKMGCRIADNLIHYPEYKIHYVEVSDAGKARLAERGLSVSDESRALADAEAVILAVPDALIGHISRELTPKLKSGTLVIALDPAAAYAGELPPRDDISYFIAHPCHPPLFHDETDPRAQTDWFGGVHAKHHIVCALHAGPEEAYAQGEAIARAMFAPVMRANRVTTEQMAILEPALVETLCATLLTALKEGLDEVVRMGVPKQAAEDMLFGHIRTEVAIVFGISGFPLSDGAIVAVEKAKSRIFQPDWKEKVFALENVRQSVDEIVKG
jgi:D-apionate oxidoisomerase